MRIYIQMKAVGKRKPVLDNVPYELPEEIGTLRDFLSALVKIEAERYNQKGTDVQVVPYLTKEEVEDQASLGKVGFGRIYSDKKADPAKAVENALQCFADGIYRIFLDDAPLENLEDRISVTEQSVFTFVRLTMLAGRMW